jgi:hypothetical protein
MTPQALELFARAMAIETEHLGPTHPVHANTLCRAAASRAALVKTAVEAPKTTSFIFT